MKVHSMDDYYKHERNISPFEAMNIETFRIASFEQWPSDAGARPLALAAAGFYHSGGPNSYEVKCFSCDLSVSQWEPHQDPLAVHRQLAPHCPFLHGNTGTASRAVPENISVQVYDENLSLKDCPPLLQSLGTEPSSPPPDAATGTNGPQDLKHSPGIFHSDSASGLSGNDRLVSKPSTPEDGTGDIRTKPNFGFLDRMRSEEERKATYHDWTYGHCQSASVLAKAGFFFTGVQDRTQCAFCRGILRSWESTDDPREEHEKHFPSCPFVLGREVNNVSLEPSDETTALTLSAESDTKLGILTGQAKHPKYAILATRELSYQHPGWKGTARQTPKELSAAGFFYTGHADNVKCFSCDGGLRNWEPQDDPWKEHAKWFPRCSYVRLTKGDAFVQEVHNGHSMPSDNPSTSASSSSLYQAQGAAPTAATEDMRRAIRARMDTEMVKSVVQMGYPKEIVRKVIENRLLNIGDDFRNAMELLEAIFSMEEKMNEEKQRARSAGAAVPEMSSSAGYSPGRESPMTSSVEEDPKSKKSGKSRKRNRKKKHLSEVPTVSTEPQDSKQENSIEEMQSLLQENEEMKEQKICKVCMDNDCNVVFLPCGHLVCCTNCAPALRHCPICRTLIKGTVRVYLS